MTIRVKQYDTEASERRIVTPRLGGAGRGSYRRATRTSSACDTRGACPATPWATRALTCATALRGRRSARLRRSQSAPPPPTAPARRRRRPAAACLAPAAPLRPSSCLWRHAHAWGPYTHWRAGSPRRHAAPRARAPRYNKQDPATRNWQAAGQSSSPAPTPPVSSSARQLGWPYGSVSQFNTGPQSHSQSNVQGRGRPPGVAGDAPDADKIASCAALLLLLLSAASTSASSTASRESGVGVPSMRAGRLRRGRNCEGKPLRRTCVARERMA